MKGKIDSNGRISIPQSIQDNLKLSPGDSFKIELTSSGILLTPIQNETKTHSESIIVLGGRPKDKPKYFTVK